MPSAILEAPVETPPDTLPSSKQVDSPPSRRTLQDAETGRFLPGNRSGGRPKGSKSFEKVLHGAANRLASAYVKTALKGNATVLVDSRKYFLGDESVITDGTRVVIFLGSDALPRQFSDAVPTKIPSQPMTPVPQPLVVDHSSENKDCHK